ncbi:hypothetical protein [Deinococcus sp. JMULE3]|uniref:hypothetical protein n=1 Tax=Deinococcus sp. JMULE3 TaxID=2518341 RepID=UPI0015750AA7|nr:hypothetical protein [Deinococcus sp. JMULE3]NTY02087.1 hypothetical protein [Deinococcus sp. JMULE3]
MTRPLALSLAMFSSAALAVASSPPKASVPSSSVPTPSVRSQLPADGSPFLKAGQVWRLTSPLVASSNINVSAVQNVTPSILVFQRKVGGLGVVTDEMLASDSAAQGGPSLILMQMGVINKKVTSRWCVIHPAHHRLNEQQVGLFHQGSLDDAAFQAARAEWLRSGVLPDYPTCTLTRVK